MIYNIYFFYINQSTTYNEHIYFLCCVYYEYVILINKVNKLITLTAYVTQIADTNIIN